MDFKKLIKTLGPGLLYAGAAVGVSHLVQSTRAGASFGFELMWVIVIANILKYPFFEFAPRYTAATGNNLITGYSKIGRWAVWIYLAVTIASMFVLQSGVTVVTAGLVASVFGISISTFWISAFLLVLTATILIIGNYSILDKLIKYVIVILALSTLVAVISAYFKNGFNPNPEMVKLFDLSNPVDVAFLIAFFGWMPGPIDISVWQSIWAEAKRKEMKMDIDIKAALLDFNIGYIGTVVLAFGFLSLGALIMYGQGQEFSGASAVFAGQLIDLFTSSIGIWAYPVIATAALATMFSTTLTCFDAYTRSMVPALNLSFEKLEINTPKKEKNWWIIMMIVLMTGTLIILGFFMSNMKQMVDFATTLSFVLAPALAFLNYKVVTHSHMPESHKPKKIFKLYALISLIIMTGFSAFFIYWRFL
ncbi:MAG: transporter [Bacteroidetes bacterium 4572_112]|nr:MAG: transporter [Bacteroidetes bacterium 4572_112]